MDEIKDEKLTKSLFLAFLAIIFVNLANFALTNMAARYITDPLGASTDIASYTISFFGIGNALTMPLAIHLKDVFGIKKLMIVCMILFTLTSLITAFATSYAAILIYRLLQGMASGPLFVLVTCFMKELANKETREKFFRCVLVTFIVAPIIGGVFGGTIAYYYRWEMIFYLDAILLLGVTIWTVFSLYPFKFEMKKISFDCLGYIFFFIGVLCLGLSLILGQRLDWFRSEIFLALFIKGSISTLFFIVWSLSCKNPILDLKLLKDNVLDFGLFQLIVLFSCYFGMSMLLSLWLNIYISYSIKWINLVLAVMPLTGFLVMFAIKSLKNKKSYLVLFFATILLCISCFYTSTFDSMVNFNRILISRVIAGFGLALFLPPLFHLVVEIAEKDVQLKSVTFFQFTRAMSSSLGIAFFTTIWQRRAAFYHSRLGGQLTIYSEDTLKYLDKFKDFDLSKMMRVNELSSALSLQSRTLAINDCFYLMGWILLASAIFTFGFWMYRLKEFKKEKEVEASSDVTLEGSGMK